MIIRNVGRVIVDVLIYRLVLCSLMNIVSLSCDFCTVILVLLNFYALIDMSKLFVVSDVPGDIHYIVDYREVLCSCSDHSVAVRLCDFLNKNNF